MKIPFWIKTSFLCPFSDSILARFEHCGNVEMTQHIPNSLLTAFGVMVCCWLWSLILKQHHISTSLVKIFVKMAMAPTHTFFVESIPKKSSKTSQMIVIRPTNSSKPVGTLSAKLRLSCASTFARSASSAIAALVSDYRSAWNDRLTCNFC